MGRQRGADVARLRSHSQQVAGVRTRLAAAWPHASGGGTAANMGGGERRARSHAAHRDPAGPNAGAALRDRWQRRRQRIALWPLRQATRVRGLGGRSVAVATGAARRSALRTRRRGRRLRLFRFPRRHRRVAGSGPAAPALRGVDRGLRRERQLRSALLHGRIGGRHRHPGSGRLPRRGMRQLRSAMAHHLSARRALGHVDRASVDRRRSLGRRRRCGAVQFPAASPADRTRGKRGDGPARRCVGSECAGLGWPSRHCA